MNRTTKNRKARSNEGNSSLFTYTNLAIIGGIFLSGIAVGIGIDSTTTFTPENVASRDFIDRSVANPELCVQYGASAMVMDTRLYVTLNPFSVYISQPIMQPGCVLRRNNWAIIEKKKLVTRQQVSDCKNRMNTFGFTGNIDASPKISCIYQNDNAENFFLNQPGTGIPASETQNF